MTTVVVLVTGRVMISRRTILLVDIEDDSNLLAATELAHDRCMAGDVEWREELAGKENYRAIVKQTQPAEEIVELLTSARDRPAGLDHDEQEWLNTLEQELGISPNEIGRFNARRKVG